MNSHLSTWIRAACAPLLTLALFVACTQPARAQSQDAQKQELQQLKDRLQQLEQSMQELKTQINALERGQPLPPAPAAPAPPPVVVQGAPPPPGEVEKKKEESKPGSTMELYGFIMLDTGYEFGQQQPDWYDVVRPTKQPSFPGEFAPNGNWYAGVRQTRFGVKTSTPTRLGELKTQFEFELFGTGTDAGQTTFRLRHAYGELGQFGGGQTWSPFMDIDVFPNSLEYWGPNGMVFFRNVQFRWMPIKGESRVTIALERPGASADQGIYADRIELQGIKPKFDMPDISWEARLGRKWGYVELAGIFRKISWVDTNNDAFDLSGTALGWGLNLSSNVKFGKKTTGRFQVVYGEGIENYMNDAPVDIGIKNNFGNPITPIKGVPLPLLGIVSFVDHNWSDRFSTSIGYSMLDIQNSDAQKANDFHQGHYGLVNLLYYPVKDVMIGSEFQWGRRINFSDGFNVNDYRIQFSARYNFSRLFGQKPAPAQAGAGSE